MRVHGVTGHAIGSVRFKLSDLLANVEFALKLGKIMACLTDFLPRRSAIDGPPSACSDDPLLDLALRHRRQASNRLISQAGWPGF